MNSVKQLRDFDSFFELVNYFDTEKKCVDYLALLRWNGKPECQYCGHDVVYELKGKFPRYKCAKCRKQFSVRVGTIFEDSKIPLRKWFFAVYLFSAHKKGVSSHQLARDLKITQKSSWFMLHRIRESFVEEHEKYNAVHEIDESFFGGKEKNKHKNKRTENTQGRSIKTKVPVLGILQRKGKVYAVPVKDTTFETLYPIIESKIEKGSKVYTDEWRSYKPLRHEFEHSIVNHSVNEYVSGEGEVHTNNLECFWSHVKRGISGIYHHASNKHLHRYINEFTFRFNNREMTDGSRFDVYLANATDKITYEKLTCGEKS
jgi:transposase-like protein